MKTIFVGDIHGVQTWKYIVNTQKFDRIVFVGDYFDSFDIKGDDQINNFLDLIAYKESTDKEVIFMIGNHDHHYFASVGYTGTSGYQWHFEQSISHVLENNKRHLQMAYQFDNILCTHAGVSEVFMDEVFGKGDWKIDNIANDLNDLWKYKPLSFCFDSRSYDSTGDSVTQSPIWIRPRSLQKASQEIKKHGIIQIVGHTSQHQIDIKGKSTGGKYYYIDTLVSRGEYLILEDDKFSVDTVR